MSDRESNRAHALAALQWAARCAEDGANEPAPIATAADYRAASKQALPDVRASLDRVLLADNAEEGLEALRTCGALAALLPAVEQMVGFGDGEWRHKDLWKHTKQVVRQAAPRRQVRWAALLHDIGKVKTRSISADGQVHFFGHAEVGARMIDKMERRIPLLSDGSTLCEAVRFLVLNHLRASQYTPSWTDSAVRRFAREMGAHMDDLFRLSCADITTKRPERKRRGLQQINDLQQRVTALAAQDAKRPPLPKGVGDAIMHAFGLAPSRRIGDIKRNLEAAVRAGRVAPHQEADRYVAFLRDNPALLE